MADREKKMGRQKYKKWISPEQKELFRWNKKTFFINFEGLSFGEIEIWQKMWTQALKVTI